MEKLPLILQRGDGGGERIILPRFLVHFYKKVVYHTDGCIFPTLFHGDPPFISGIVTIVSSVVSCQDRGQKKSDFNHNRVCTAVGCCDIVK